MRKTLEEMTLEELWALFPIQLTEHKEYWKDWYQQEADFLSRFLPGGVRLFHIGRTAIPGIWAKPIIDILAEAPLDEHQRITELLLARGYAVMSQSQGRVSLNKGYTPEGFAKRVFHLHLRQPGDYNELYFRDYLTEHPETAKEYERLKLALWKQFEHNRDEYTARKTVFIQKYTQLAVAQYGKDRFK